MHIRVLGTYGYRGELDYEWNQSVDSPSWIEIESAIRRLDSGEYAGLVLHKDDYREGEAALNAFAVTGGPEGYLVTISRSGNREIVLTDLSKPKGGELLCVCQRDQGVWVPICKVCRDLKLVLVAAQHYSDSGEPWPGCEWT
jgi:hypothetical protein